tara:strand:+ start:649 stop:1668 length:1020 start_codon:yes stop_codon:yes gene_type:complete
LISPAVLQEELPAGDTELALVSETRDAIGRILRGEDRRVLAIVGPCSIHDPVSAHEYAERLFAGTRDLTDDLLIVMRVYFEKPRTVVGWKGLINDPHLDGSFAINEGLRTARRVLRDVLEVGLPAGTEFLDTTFGQFYADLVSWGAIGARTAESQIHRELASGLSMPVGIKNRTDGDVQIAVDGIRAAGHKHLFPTLTKEGAPAIYETSGNADCHLILRGGSLSGPNYDAASVADAAGRLAEHSLVPGIVVDCSHGNSNKDEQNQISVCNAVAEQIEAGSDVRGVMLESHLLAGNQSHAAGQPIDSLTYGLSITDKCLALDDTLPLLRRLAEAARGRPR